MPLEGLPNAKKGASKVFPFMDQSNSPSSPLDSQSPATVTDSEPREKVVSSSLVVSPLQESQPVEKSGAERRMRVFPGSKHGLSPRHEKFLEGLIAGKSMLQAALAAGFPRRTALNAGAKILPVIQRHTNFRKEFERLLPGRLLVARIVQGLNAKETKFFQHEGEVTDTRKVIAWSERRLYSELAARVLGELKSDGGSNTKVPVAIKVEIVHVGGGSDSGKWRD
jgi:hypothetical protein